MIQFLLNRELRSEHALDPNLTVLDYLREHRGKTGTKEGCASGDCGACTVVVGELEGERLRYRTLNSCLTFVASLHGKQLISVEDLKHQGRLHSVQQAMVDCHGSQCGFCTPGFVMSLFALQKNASGQAPDKAQTLEALAGNLCRCTGYRPILDAAAQACQQAQPDHFDQAEAATVEQLKAIAPRTTASLEHNGKHCLLPLTIGELAELYRANPEARLLAGGTDLALEVTQQHRSLPAMIYVGHIAALKRIEVTDDTLVIGAAAPLTDCYTALADDYPDFGELLHRFASLQIRNQGTLGGNIGNASPIGDAPPLLIALGATLVLRQGNRTRRLALEDYFIDYKVTARQEAEFIEAIHVPRPRAGQSLRAYKVSKRLDDDISAVCAAFNLTLVDGVLREARVAFGGMAAIAKRARACEAVLQGAPLGAELIERACAALAHDFTPLSDFRASQAYRLLTAQNLLRKCFLELTAPGVATRVTDYV
ncbi:xanthine dehydrogenase small subunit [Pseudomonas cuatrocienegasensis]|uniref:Xanthine dehydrogenase small subunit n=1 Tax=Pseudomonas cuatrocienegasensis TaxID=543360 RepID=A0ABY1B234_9PSED|nr:MULTISPECIES: xanthine dehydrogenase small subunit [Pseudomonas]OEC36400.1 xanthine dehydrogenase small subunit [Pseudomonas sp. 21C1]SEP73043.1 xanthine dehydrogenase small subunit [Pseudomonas cuatrocienegasensis]